MDIKTFKMLAHRLPAEHAILMRGPTGVGKSFLAVAAAKELGLPFIDVRGSTMDESKVTGIPDFVASKELGVSTFVLPSWFVRACREPALLMLDEINRSMPQVMQAFFQIVLDRELGNDGNGNPMKLHPETRVWAAGNFGVEYDVGDVDPALLRRFWTQDIECTNEDWLEWATATGLDPVLIDFIRQNPIHLRVDPGTVESGTVCPAPASWHRLNDSLVHMGMAPEDVAGSRPDGFYALCTGYVGLEASIAFTEFVSKYELQVSAKMVLDGKVNTAMARKMKASESVAVLEKLIIHCTDNNWTANQVDNIGKMLKGCSEEQTVLFWNKLMKTKNMTNIKLVHKKLGDEVIAMVAKARALGAKKKS
jgi:hypothetical protein|tara:strand:+ start:199 stop:1293 length:1095 start_codon:yes stop_codon:yes gene_type:complete